MSVRFVIGRAGTGKTHSCLEAIRRRLSENPVDGPRLILLVPEQASQQMERAILLPAQDGRGCNGAAHRAEVLSFQRLAFRVLESVTAQESEALSESARTMLLVHLMKRLGPRLRYYRRSDRLSGLAERLSASVTELIQEGIRPDDLPGGSSEKLHDLALLYREYLGALHQGRMDSSQYLAVAREALPRCEWLCGAELWVDGFASMSGEELATLIELARVASQTWITALVDPASVEPITGSRATEAADGLFHRTVETYGELVSRLKKSGLSMEAPLKLGPATPRFARNESLAHLEANWGRVAASAPPPTGVQLVELPSRRVEVEFAVSTLCRWAREWGLRYRDVAIIARDLEPYHDLLGTALSARGIPYFVDRRRSLAHHPLVELIRGAVAVAVEDFSLEAVRPLLKTGLLSLSMEEGDKLENYLLAHGLAGQAVWLDPDWTERLRRDWGDSPADPGDAAPAIERINTARRRVLTDLEPWYTEAVNRAPRTGKDWQNALARWLEGLGTGRTLARWTKAAEAAGRSEEAGEHRQVWRQVFSLLDDVGFAFGDTALTLDELQNVLEAGLSTLTLALAPPALDQVLLGAIERSRHPELQAAVVIGFNEGFFPGRATEDSILNDEERSSLREGGLRLRPPASERVFDESLLAYIALTRPSRALAVTYAVADEQGKALAPSPYVRTLLGACPGLRVESRPDPLRARQMWDVHGASDLRRRLALEFADRPPLGRDEARLRGRWNALYDSARETHLGDGLSRRVLSWLADPLPAALSPAAVRMLLAPPLRSSVSQLECYAACGFQHFARYGLDLRERADAAVQAVDLGQLHHAVLEECVSRMVRQGTPLSEASADSLAEVLRESCLKIAERLPRGGVLSNARNAYLVRRSASQLARVLQAQRNIARAGTTRVRGAEVAYGFSGGESLPALTITTPRGRVVHLRGFIDRVDLAEMADELLGVVVDYKLRRDPRLDLSRVFHGLSLQLVTYLLVLAEHGKSLAGRGIRPVAGFFVSLAPKVKRLEHPDEAGDRDLVLGGTPKPRGLLRFDALEVLDSELEGGYSPYYSVHRTKSGELGRAEQGDAATREQFETTLDHTRRVLGTLADRLLDGDIAVRPFRLGGESPCSWCPMGSVCGFEWGVGEARFLERMRRSEAFVRLARPE